MSADSEDEIVYNGFRRVHLDKSAGHKAKLEEDGLVFCGYTQMHQEKARSRPPSAKPTVVKVIDLVSSDDEDDRRGPGAPRTSGSVSAPSSSTASGVPRAGSSTGDGSTRASDKVCAPTLNRRSSCDHPHTAPDTCRCPTARCGRTQAAYQGELYVNFTLGRVSLSVASGSLHPPRLWPNARSRASSRSSWQPNGKRKTRRVDHRNRFLVR